MKHQGLMLSHIAGGHVLGNAPAILALPVAVTAQWALSTSAVFSMHAALLRQLVRMFGAYLN